MITHVNQLSELFLMYFFHMAVISHIKFLLINTS